jgi:sugar lactone lactonase YvrE
MTVNGPIGPIRDWVCDDTGQLIFVDELNHRILVLSKLGFRAVGQKGFRPGEFRYPSAVALLGTRVYVADSNNHRIQALRLPSLEFDFEFGGLGSAAGQFFCPRGIVPVETREHGTLLCVADCNNNRLSFHKADGTCVAVYDLSGRRFPVAVYSSDPSYVEVRYEDGKSDLLKVDTLVSQRDEVVAEWLALRARTDLSADEMHRVNRQVLERLDRVELQEYQLSVLPRPVYGCWDASFERPISLVSDASGFFYVSDFGRCDVRKFDTEGKPLGAVLPPGRLLSPGKMAVHGDLLFVTGGPEHRIAICDLTTGATRDWDPEIPHPGVIASDGQHLWLASYDPNPAAVNRSIHVFDATLGHVRSFEVRDLRRPTCIAVGADRILVGDEAECKVFVVDFEGTTVSHFGQSIFCAPVWSVRVDAFGGVWAGSGRKLHYFDPALEFLADFYPDGAVTSGPVVDISLGLADRVHFIDFERSAVRWVNVPRADLR